MFILGTYIYIMLLKILLSYFCIELCQILHWSNLGPVKFINLYCLRICGVLIYRFSSVYLITQFILGTLVTQSILG